MEILNTETVFANDGVALVFSLLLAIGVVTFIVGVLDSLSSKNDWKKFVHVWVLGLLVAITSGFALSDLKEVAQYEVVLKEGYMIDATKYQIVEQRGKIYVIKELKQIKGWKDNE